MLQHTEDLGHSEYRLHCEAMPQLAHTMKEMRLTFVLPQLYDHPIGGYKVVYQYANLLAERGHQVTLVHPISGDARPAARDYVALLAAKFRQATTGKPPISWFELDSDIHSVLLLSLSSRLLPSADVTILTAWETAERTREPAPQAGVLAQLVHDYEFWKIDAEVRPRIEAALGRPDVRQIATSNAVSAMLHEFGREPVDTVSAGLLEGEFGVDVPIENRQRVVVFQARLEPAKDFHTALAAATIILSEEPSVKVECFGSTLNVALPHGMKSLGIIAPAELRAAYNRASVFFSSSRYEGWGLPMAEAMACGAAVVSTRNGGVEDFLRDEVNGLLVPIENARAIADSVLRLLRDEKQRVRLATQGTHDAVLLSVQKSGEKLERVLESLLD